MSFPHGKTVYPNGIRQENREIQNQKPEYKIKKQNQSHKRKKTRPLPQNLPLALMGIHPMGHHALRRLGMFTQQC